MKTRLDSNLASNYRKEKELMCMFKPPTRFIEEALVGDDLSSAVILS
jgi:hypothetical protein